nr:deoxyguanosine kinase [Salmonid herpesvirus 1]
MASYKVTDIPICPPEMINFLNYENTHVPTKKSILFIEGNIASGKTTLLNNLGVPKTFREPVGEWLNLPLPQGSYDALKAVKEGTLNPYLFQVMVSTGMWLRAKHERCQVIDRSVFTSANVFSQIIPTENRDPPSEFILMRLQSALSKDILQTMDVHFLYLRSTPENCFRRKDERCLARPNSVDPLIGVDYLTLLHEKHEDWLMENGQPKANVTVIDVEGRTKEEIATIATSLRESLSLSLSTSTSTPTLSPPSL